VNVKKTRGSYPIVCLLVFALVSCLPAEETISLVGCGSVIPSPLYGVWADAYASRNPRVQIKYLPLGSGEGIKQITAGSADFAAGEIPISDKEMAATGKKIVHLPLFLTAVVPIYNVPGVNQKLRFSGKVLAGIFSGEIKRWNSPELLKLNPGAQLPDMAITVVHREPGKGTTYLITDFLSRSSPSFHAKIGTDSSPNWPVGVTAQGAPTMVKMVSETPGGIGYAELNTAKTGPVGIGLVQNASGAFVEASPESAAAACPQSLKGDFRVSFTNMPGESVYPITGFSWMFVTAEGASPSRSEALRGFLKFVFTDGQSMIAARGHMPLPPRIVASVLNNLKLD
jgi:phosphate transport system substrate-binding protein